MASRIGLETVVSYLPEEVVRRSDWAYLDAVVPPGQETMFRGPDELRRLRDENAVEILAENVARKALATAALQPSDIDFIIAGNIGGKRVYPLVGTYIHHKLGFRVETPVLNMQNFCASFVDGINVAWDLVRAGRYRRVLVVVVTAVATRVGVDLTNPMAKGFGDGAGAAVVSAENLKYEFLSYSNQTFGELYDHMYMAEAPVMNPGLMAAAGIKDDRGIFLAADEWFWQSPFLSEDFAVKGIRQALAAANLTDDDLDLIFLHHFLDVLHDRWVEGGIKAGIPAEKWRPVTEGWNKLANCGNVDVAAGLADYTESGRVPMGAVIALFPPGLGGHTPCMIIRRVG